MQSFEELMAMPEDSLNEMAESLGMKKNSISNKEDLVYYVIDHTSVKVAKEEAARLKPRAAKERKPRAKRTAGEALAVAPSAEDASAAAVTPQPKKRLQPRPQPQQLRPPEMHRFRKLPLLQHPHHRHRPQHLPKRLCSPKSADANPRQNPRRMPRLHNSTS